MGGIVRIISVGSTRTYHRPHSLTEMISSRARHHLDRKQSYPTFESEMMKGACDEYTVIHTQMIGVQVTNSDQCGDGLWCSAAPHVSCKLTLIQATEQSNEASAQYLCFYLARKPRIKKPLFCHRHLADKSLCGLFIRGLHFLFLVINAAFSCNQKHVESPGKPRIMMPMLGNPERAPYAKPAHAMARSIVVNSAFGLLGLRSQDKSLVP